MKKYVLWLLWLTLRCPSVSFTGSTALFLPWLSRLFLVQGRGPQEQEMLVVGQPNVFTVEVIPYSFRSLLFSPRRSKKERSLL